MNKPLRKLNTQQNITDCEDAGTCQVVGDSTWQCKYYNGPYTTDCPFGEREYKEVERDA